MESREIISLVKEISNLGVSSFEYTEGNIHISMKFQENGEPAVTQTVRSMPENVQQTEVQMQEDAASEMAEGKVITSPLVGTFYAAPAEGAAPYVSVGDRVKKGQTLGIVEAMKLMNEIESEYDGVLTQILVKNGEAVEYGQAMFAIRVDAQ
ncbi:MAG: acetyl-CoA carboxylase biotin carboxyl carrier protein [Muricoprocola sp.]